MVKKVTKRILYLLGGLNMGVASAVFPAFIVLFGLIFGFNPITTPLGLSALGCGVVATVLLLMHYKNCQKQRSNMDGRVLYAYIGFMLGVAIAILIALTWSTFNDTGIINGVI